MSSYDGYLLLAICCLFGLASAATWIEYQKPTHGKELFCVDKIEGKKRVGDVWNEPAECIQKRCLTDSQGTLLISYAGCGVVAIDPASSNKCRIVVGNGTYPDCCPRPKCDED